MIYGRIYRITNKLNGMSYIGQTTNTIYHRFMSHCEEKRNNRHISNAIQFYGKDNFIVEELCLASNQNQLNELENYYVEILNTMYPYGYNHRSGGFQNGKCSDELRKKISESKLGKPNLKRRGEIRTDEQRLKISRTLGGKMILAKNLDDNRQIYYMTAHETKLDGHNPSNVVSICKKNSYRTHSKRWVFEYIENNANQSGSFEFKNS